MSVTSTPITSQEPKVTRTYRYDAGSIIGALVGLAIGAVVWIFGARYTVDGLVLGSNIVLEFLTIPARIAPRWELYLWLLVIPLAFSAVEWTCSPIGRSRIKHPGLIMAWIVVITLDIGSTVLGLAAAKSPAALVTIVSTVYGIGLLSVLLTFGPEAMMKSCGGLLWRALRTLFK